jgi:DNA-directed RNA polymerase specialized sigma subunit
MNEHQNGLYHPLVHPEKEGASAEKNQAWLEEIRSLPPNEQLPIINEMIEGNIPLAFLKLKTFVELFPGFKYMWDDMVSEGMLALTEAVHALAGKSIPEDDGDIENNPQGYIGIVVVRKVGRMLESQTEKLPRDYISPLDKIIDPRDLIETQDFILRACETKLDRVIIDMRARGCKQQEIADRLELSRQSIQVHLAEIIARYERLLDEIK